MKKHAGFTLIELLVAIAVLSIMTGVLLRYFTMSATVSKMSREDEKILNLAQETMEMMKGYPMSSLEGKFKEDSGTEESTGTSVTIGSDVWDVKETKDGDGNKKGYLFTSHIQKGISHYIVEAEADYGEYAVPDADEGDGFSKDSVSSVNLYEMPRIADISNVQNIVISPEDLLKEDELMTERLLAKVNPSEEEDEEEGSGGGGASGGSSDEGGELYGEDDVRKILNIAIDSSSGGKKMTATVQLIYTVYDGAEPDKASGYPSELTIKTGVISGTRTIVKNDTEDRIENGIYLFLPKDFAYNRIFVNAVKRPSDGLSYPVYLIAPGEGSPYTEDLDQLLKTPVSGGSDEIVTIFSNIQRQNGSLDRGLTDRLKAQNRIYAIGVTIYKAVKNSGEWEKGEKRFYITSTKRE